MRPSPQFDQRGVYHAYGNCWQLSRRFVRRRGATKAAGDAMALAEALSAPSSEEGLSVYDMEHRSAGNLIQDFGRRLGAQLEAPEIQTVLPSAT